MRIAMHRQAENQISELERFFDDTSRGFDLAASRLGASTHEFRVADRHLRVRFAGQELKHLARPLSHLKYGQTNDVKCDSRSPSAAVGEVAELEILAWESASGWLPPRPPWDFRRLVQGGAIAGLENERILVNYSADHGLLSLYHRPSRRALYWLPEARRLPYWEIAAPFRILLHWWSQSFGGQVTHAAAVGFDGQGVLLAGRGGSGKSTTAISCVDAGMEYVGDDYVLLTRAPTPTAHSLYHSAKIHTAFLRRALPHWQRRVAAEIGPEHKSLAFLHESVPHQVRDRLAIRAVIQPKVGAEFKSVLLPQASSLGLLAVAPSTMYQLPEARQETLSFLADWLRDVPTSRLKLGRDLASAPDALCKLLAERGMCHAA
jgi:hypothetical protein